MRTLGCLLIGIAVAACAVHEPYSFRAADITVGDRGISIPVPPPSLTAEPKQDSTVEGEVEFSLTDDTGDATLHLIDLVSGATAQAEVTAPVDAFSLTGVQIDHSDNCLELWLMLDGDESAHAQYHTVIAADDQSVDVVPGCE